MKIENLLISGGGIKGIASAASLEYLDENNKLKDLKKIVGSSIGALIGTLMCCNISLKQIKLLLKGINFSELQKFDVSLFLSDYGFDQGDNFLKFFNTVLLSKNLNPEMTFQELHKISKYELILIGTNISKSKTTYFSYKDFPDFKVRDALKISAGYPIAFTPSIINGDKYADGAIASPMGSELLTEKEKEITLGIAIHRGIPSYNTDSLPSYLFSIIGCIVDSLTDWNVKNLKHCIKISYPLHAMDFDINDEQKSQLEEEGIRVAKEWLDNLEESKTKK